jgi:hypothetical protein
MKGENIVMVLDDATLQEFIRFHPRSSAFICVKGSWVA